MSTKLAKNWVLTGVRTLFWEVFLWRCLLYLLLLGCRYMWVGKNKFLGLQLSEWFCWAGHRWLLRSWRPTRSPMHRYPQRPSVPTSGFTLVLPYGEGREFLRWDVSQDALLQSSSGLSLYLIARRLLVTRAQETSYCPTEAKGSFDMRAGAQTIGCWKAGDGFTALKSLLWLLCKHHILYL